MSQSSHLDWDWRRTFEQYFVGPPDRLLLIFPGSVDTILSEALGLMSRSHTSGPRYYYSIAEVAYLARFVAAHPELVDALRAVGTDLRIVGGGLTSPDSLLPPGESFIRDYLVGKTWVDATFGLPIRQAWLPDDFGHDAQLPVVLEAMGFDGVGFARVPGVDTTAEFLSGKPAARSQAAELLHDGLDFVWRAADGSRTVAHWMPGSYCQGDYALGAPRPGDEPVDALRRLVDTNGAASPTPYVFIPIGCDFNRPRPDLLDLVRTWNLREYERTGIWAVAASFDHYVELVGAHRASLRRRRFDPTPYWTGFYAMRPVLKQLHLQATQALLAAETLGAIADGAVRDDAVGWRAHVQARSAAIHAGWTALVPANHHDYVTGTALDPVYEGEQVPRLAAVLAQGEAERTRALAEIAAAIRPSSDAGDTVVLFNPLGFARREVVDVGGRTPVSPITSGARGIEQPSAEGGRLFVARLPSLGYATEERARIGHTGVGSSSVQTQADGAVVVLENRFLRATIRRDAGWGITSFVDKHARTELIERGEVANAFVQYSDDGGLYRFGSEMQGCRLEPRPVAVSSAAGVLREPGPLRARFDAETTIDGRPFRKIYELVAGEPFLRMLSSGSAPPGTSVMVHFPLGGRVDRLVHGTAYHWDRKRPERAGPLTFEATHDFLVPELRRRPRAAIFHAAVPAWAARKDGLVVGALWRNAMQERCDLYGAQGTDDHEATVSYALRIPSGIRGPRAGAQLREALAFETPVLAIAGRPAGALPRVFSLASALPPRAIITAAKVATAEPSTLVLRVYQPTNAPLRVKLRTSSHLHFPRGRSLAIEGATALEVPLHGRRAAALHLTGSATSFDFLARRALTTLEIRAAEVR